MKFGTLMIINAVISLAFGLSFVLVPGQSLHMYGVTADAPLELVARLLGSAFLGYGVMTWSARSATASEVRRPVLLSIFVGDGVGFFVALIAQLGGVVNAMGWSTVVIYLLLALGCGYFLFLKSSDS